MSLYYDIIWFTLGLCGILWGRQIPSSDMIGDEHQLSFGQIVTMLMLGSLLLTFKEVYTGISLKPRVCVIRRLTSAQSKS